jgi:hypothetical protein
MGTLVDSCMASLTASAYVFTEQLDMTSQMRYCRHNVRQSIFELQSATVNTI